MSSLPATTDADVSSLLLEKRVQSSVRLHRRAAAAITRCRIDAEQAPSSIHHHEQDGAQPIRQRPGAGRHGEDIVGTGTQEMLVDANRQDDGKERGQRSTRPTGATRSKVTP